MKNGMKILFQGDSITDTGRSREDVTNRALGDGYACMTAADLLASNPESKPEICNRGVSGNRIVDLYARWKSDALNLSPDLISILIGVNDTWHAKGSNNGVGVKRYQKIYDMLLEWTLERLPDVKLVLCQPFALVTGAVSEDWMPEIHERGEVVKELAGKYNTVFVPFQPMFDDAAKKASAEYWLGDGVHPTLAGHRLMADLWMKSVAL